MLSKAGKEKDNFLVVVGTEGKMLRLADGKRRTLEKPKLKKDIHVQGTNIFLNEEQLMTDKKIRNALKDHNAKVNGGYNV